MGNKAKIVKALLFNLIETQKHMLSGKQVPLRHLNFEITDACNSRCNFCNIWQTKKSEDILTADEIINIFKDPYFKSLKSMIITGGEPFLRNDLNEVLYGINQSIPGVNFALSTNGLLTDRILNTAEFCIKNKINFAIGISLDDIGERHDLLRGVPGNFKKTDYLVRELVSLRERSNVYFDIVLAHCLCDEGVESLPRVKKYAEDMCVNFLTQIVEEFSFYNNVVDTLPEEKADNEYERKKYDLAPEEIIKKMRSTPHGLKSYFRDNNPTLKVNKIYQDNQPLIFALENLKPHFHRELLRQVLRKGPLKFNCFALRNFYFMRCNGDVTPCLRYAHVPVGNLRRNTASEIFTGERAKAARKVIRGCDGCANTWATDWSLEASFISFTGLLIKSVLAKRKYKKTACYKEDKQHIQSLK